MGLLHAIFSSLTYRSLFQPPVPYYTLEEKEESKTLELKLRHVLNPDVPTCNQDYINTLNVFKIKTKRGNDIVAIYIKHPSATKTTLLFSHTNAEDLGFIVRVEGFRELSDDLGVNVMAYDYSGYGHSTGKPSEKDTYADIEAAYGFLVDKFGAKEEDVILHGNSIGTGPTIDLATKLPKLKGVVLESGIASVLRVASLYFCGIKLKRRSYSFDIYKNIKKVGLINCPVLVIHGKADELIDLWHGEQLWSRLKYPYEPLWIEGGEHNDLDWYPEYKQHLKNFVSDMEILYPYRKKWPELGLKK